MRHILIFIMTVGLTLHVTAQQTATTLFGIHTGDSKENTIRKFHQKGFYTDRLSKVLKGRWQGRDVNVFLITKDGIVNTIVVDDVEATPSEKEIKNRFNKIAATAGDKDSLLDDTEDLWQGIMEDNKRYETTYQKGTKNVRYVIAKCRHPKTYRIVTYYQHTI